MTIVRFIGLFQSLLTEQKRPARTPAMMPNTIDKGPCITSHVVFPLPRTARLMKSVYPVIAMASSKLAAATTVAGTAAKYKIPLAPYTPLHVALPILG